MTSTFSHIPSLDDPVSPQEIKDFRNETPYTHPRQPPKMNDDTSNVVILLGIPKVPQDKHSRLITFIRKVLNKKANAKDSEIIDIFIPASKDGMSLGFAIVELETPALAKVALEGLNDFAFDAKHTVQTRMFSDLKKFAKMDSSKGEVSFPEFKKKPLLKDWLKNTSDDQYVVKVRDKVEVYWNNIAKEGERVFLGKNFTQGNIGWSPNGNYLVSEHPTGYVLWGEEGFVSQAVLKHQHPEVIEFSPKENYAVTINDSETGNIIIWDIRMEIPSSKFTVPREESNGLPLFRWSPDEKYFARQKKDSDQIDIYLTQTFLLHKNNIQIKNLQDFSFCPVLVFGSPVIGYWTVDKDTGYATLGLLNFPTGEHLGRPITLVDVKNVSMVWSKDGTYLIIKVIRDKRVRVGTSLVKTTATDFYVFRTNSKEFPVDHIEVKEAVVAFAWEPNGNRLAVIAKHREEIGISIRNDVFLYTLEGDKVKEDLILEGSDVDMVLWSPKGRHAVLIHTEAKTPKPLFFYDMYENEQLGYGEHYKMSNAFWDPSGRFLCTVVSSRITADGEHGFIMWTFNGKSIYKTNYDGFETFAWRPRPPTILNEKQIEKVKRALPSKVKQYQLEEQRKMEEEKNEQLTELKQLWSDYTLWKQELEEYANEDLESRNELYGYDPEDQWVELEVVVQKND